MGVWAIQTELDSNEWEVPPARFHITHPPPELGPREVNWKISQVWNCWLVAVECLWAWKVMKHDEPVLMFQPFHGHQVTKPLEQNLYSSWWTCERLFCTIGHTIHNFSEDVLGVFLKSKDPLQVLSCFCFYVLYFYLVLRGMFVLPDTSRPWAKLPEASGLVGFSSRADFQEQTLEAQADPSNVCLTWLIIVLIIYIYSFAQIGPREAKHFLFDSVITAEFLNSMKQHRHLDRWSELPMWLRVLTLLGVLGQATNSVWKIHPFKRGTKIYWARSEWRHVVWMSSESWARSLECSTISVSIP